MRRRDALKLGLSAGATAVAAATLGLRAFGSLRAGGSAVVAQLTIAPIDVELAPGVTVRSIAFGGTVPGPQLNRAVGLATLELRNESDSDTAVHSAAFAEPLITIPARARARALLRILNNPPSGAYFKSYRAYCAASGAIASGTLVEGTERDGGVSAFDQLQVLSIHRWQPRPIIRTAPFNDTAIAYDYASFDDKLMSASEPIKVRYGDRVRFHFSNTSITRGVTLGLPHHRFLVMALDGHLVPRPRHVERIYIGPAESIDALVTMDRPGRWILGATHREDRIAGLGRLVEYAGATGTPVESEYGIADWDYTEFGAAAAHAAPTSTRLAAPPLSLSLSLSLQPIQSLAIRDPQLSDPSPRTAALPLKLSAGKRYRLATINFTRDPQSLQLLNHQVELVCVAGQRTAGVCKDVVTLPSFTRIEFEFIARTNEVFLAHNRQVSVEGMLTMSRPIYQRFDSSSQKAPEALTWAYSSGGT
jgi:FtsP/CotA-like multicopper oxidase with cupredoxin domain